MSTDLFGAVPPGAERVSAKCGPKGGKHYTKPNGYAAPPGTGPANKKCKDCAHYVKVFGGVRNYPKCELREASWTAGRGSDILVNSPACRRFEEETDANH